MLWVAAIVLLVVVFPIVVFLLNGVLQAANSIVPSVDGIAATAAAGSKDLDAVPLLLTTQQQIEQSGILSQTVHLYREGILAMASDENGEVDEEELRRQIRLTILHEFGHHHGFNEDELEELGY